MVDPVGQPVDDIVPPIPAIKRSIRENVVPAAIKILEPFFLLAGPVVTFPADAIIAAVIRPLTPFGTGIQAQPFTGCP